ncbi:MAG: tetratricopeptide repeat protein [Ignavibacteria bacterium]
MAKEQQKKKDTVKKNTQQLKISKKALYIILAVVSFAVYANALSNEFVFDDESVVQGDPTITSLSNIPKFFTGELGFHKVIGAYFRPVVSTSYAIDYSLWQLNPVGFHLTNILIHIINVLLFFTLLMLMFEKTQSAYKEYAILIAALIFAVHPIHTEVVAWVSGRTDGLACTFFFAAFIYYLKYSKEPSNKNLALTLVLYFLSLLSKEMAITLPAVIILYDMVINKNDFKELLKKRIVMYGSLIVLSGLFMLLRWWALSQVVPRQTYFYFYDRSTMTAILTMLQTIPLYFRLSIAPYGMLYHYSGYLPDILNISDYRAIFAIVFLLVMGGAAVYFVKRAPYISYAILIFFVTLLPVMNIVPTMNFMADRFLYIPSMFFSIIIGAVLLRYFTQKHYNLIMTLSGAVLILFCYMTVTRNAEWKTNDILFQSAEGRPGTVTYVNLGNIYANKGNYDVAEVYYRKAIDLRKETLIAHNNIGKIFMVKANYDSAYWYINRAYLLDTLSPEPQFTLAQMYQRKGDINQAIKWLEKLTTFAPNYNNASQMLMELKTISQQPNNMNGNNLNGTNQQQMPPVVKDEKLEKVRVLEESSYKNYQAKNYDKAIGELDELIKMAPDRASGYYNNIGMCYMDQQKYKEAIENFEAAVKTDAKFSSAYNNIGTCYERMNNIPKARESYSKAIEVDPTNELAKQNLAKLK